MGTSAIGRAARHAGLCLAALVCAGALAPAGAQAQPPLTWSAPHVTDSGQSITALSCPSSALCVAVTGDGAALSSTSPASGSWSAPTAVDSSHSFTGVSCPSTTLCLATDNHGNVYASTSPTSTSPSAWTQEVIDGTTQLNDISCPSTTLCVAVDNTGHVLTSTAPGNAASWTTPDHVDGSNAITAVSCPTTTLCAATDVAGNVLVPATPTSASWPQTQLTSGAQLTAVSCTSSGSCVLAAANGNVYATYDVSASPITWSWTGIGGASMLTAASCSDVGACVVGDNTGDVYASDNVASGQPSWSKTDVDASHPLTALACLTAGLCVAADSSGSTLTATLSAPSVSTGAGSASSQTAASVAATVNPNDAVLTDCHFDYGTSTAYGSSVPCTIVPTPTGGTQAVSAQIGGLSAGTTYHFRIVASSGVATGDGADATFTTQAALKPSPSISGTPAVGSTLTCKANVTTTAGETVAYQWLSDTQPIAGATSATYTVAVTDETHHLSCQVTISGDGGSAAATSGFDGVPATSGGAITESFVGTDRRGADSVSAPVSCSPQAAGHCTVKLVLTTSVTKHHVTTAIKVGSRSATLTAGAKQTLTVTLNAAGKRMLKNHHSLSVTLTVTGTVIGTLTATLQTDKLTFTEKGRRDAAHPRR